MTSFSKTMVCLIFDRNKCFIINALAQTNTQTRHPLHRCDGNTLSRERLHKRRKQIDQKEKCRSGINCTTVCLTRSQKQCNAKDATGGVVKESIANGATTAPSASTYASNTTQNTAGTTVQKLTSYGQTLSRMGCGNRLASMTNMQNNSDSIGKNGARTLRRKPSQI